MKNIHMLVANTDRRTNNLVEAAVLDACFERAAVDCTRIARLGELAKCGSYSGNDLIVIAPHHLLGEPGRGQSSASVEDVCEVIEQLKYRTSAPILAVNVSPQAQEAVTSAGADAVFGIPVDIGAFKNEVREALSSHLEESFEEAPRRRWSLSTLFTF
jgi:hypothetical protein